MDLSNRAEGAFAGPIGVQVVLFVSSLWVFCFWIVKCSLRCNVSFYKSYEGVKRDGTSKWRFQRGLWDLGGSRAKGVCAPVDYCTVCFR